MIGGGTPNVANSNTTSREHRIKVKREQMKKERGNRRKKIKDDKQKNNTAAVYNQIIANMGDNYYKGYSTSEDDSNDNNDEVADQEKEKEEAPEVPDKLDKEEIAQMMLEDAI